MSGRIGYTFVPYSKLQQGTSEAANPNQLRVDVHLTSIQAVATAPTGTVLDVELPAGALVTSTLEGDRTDRGLGDLEVRVRQWLPRPRGTVSVQLAGGLALPTGGYVARAGAANLAPEASYLTLGRGAVWWLANGEARVALGRAASTALQLAARGPITGTHDDFAWGNELRLAASGQYQLARRVSGIAVVDLGWRGHASEPDPFGGDRLMTANAGGWQLGGVLGAALSVAAGWSVLAGVRVPLWNDVVGNQLVPSVGGFVALSYARSWSPPRRRPIAAGVITVIDYWASWCAPCHEIDRALAEARARWPDVVIERVDATTDQSMVPAGGEGLPVVEIFDREGRPHKILRGPDALRVVDEVDSLRATSSRSQP